MRAMVSESVSDSIALLWEYRAVFSTVSLPKSEANLFVLTLYTPRGV